MYSNRSCHLNPIRIDISLLLAALLKHEFTGFFFWHSLPVHLGSLKRIKYSKLYSLAHILLLNVFSALKGTRFYILFKVKLYSVKKMKQSVVK